MLNTKNVVVMAASILMGLADLTVANAQNAGCYTLASLQGSYSIVGQYGSNIAIALATRSFDGGGNLTGNFVVNEPTAGSSTGARTIVTGTQKGTYTVNCDGTGVITRVLTASNGTTANQMDDFVITQSVVQGGQLVATAVMDATRTPSTIVPGGVFLSRTYTRLPDPKTAGCFTLASLQGDYAVTGNYGANVALGLGSRHLDGNGNFTATFLVNEPTAGSATGDRSIVTGTQTGTYTVNCDGTGVITRNLTASNGTTANQMDDFIITGAVVQGGQLVATGLVDAQRTPSVIVPGGIFLVRTHTLRATLPAAPTAQTVAIAGPKNITVISRSIQLDGSQSTSADGKPLSYLWTITQGSPSAAILGGTTATPTVQFTQGHATYTFQLTVTDSTGASSSDVVTVDYEGS